ncbi:poly(A)-binding protein binding protein [Malassezia sp. CBS 17886]|nr:poly(A)-binding protein binding protein [Malassezia sp. CBS 17886]
MTRAASASSQRSHGRTSSRGDSPNGVPGPKTGAEQGGDTDAMHGRVVALLAMLVGQMVVVTLLGGERYVGILSAASTESGEFGVVLSTAQRIAVDTGAPVVAGASVDVGEVASLLVLPGDEIGEIDATRVRLSSAQALDAQRQAALRAKAGFRTDTEISAPMSARGDGRTLQRWEGEDGGALAAQEDAGALDEARRRHATGSWDQFAANETRFGVTSNYEETMYTTKLDRSGSDFKSRERQAEKLAKKILEGDTMNVHVAEERNQKESTDADEEDRYGAVVREPPVYAPSPRRDGGGGGDSAGGGADSDAGADADADAVRASVSGTPDLSKAGSNPKALTADFRQFVSAERERLVVRKAELAQREKRSRLADLKVWAQSFRLKTPVPDDLAERKRTGDAARVESASASLSSSPGLAPGTAAASPPPLGLKTGGMTLAAIPPFRHDRSRSTADSASISAQSAGKRASPGAAAPPKLSAKTASFNPNATAFTPGARATPKAAPKAEPEAPPPPHPFFGTRELKNLTNATNVRVRDDFRPGKKKLPPASSITAWWPYTGRPFRQQVAAVPTPGVSGKVSFPLGPEGPVPMSAAPSPHLIPPLMNMYAGRGTPAVGSMSPGQMPRQQARHGKSPHVPHQQPIMPQMNVGLQVPVQQGAAPPPAQQAYALVYQPYGQYRFPAQQPYLVPPDVSVPMPGGQPPSMAYGGVPGAPVVGHVPFSGPGMMAPHAVGASPTFAHMPGPYGVMPVRPGASPPKRSQSGGGGTAGKPVGSVPAPLDAAARTSVASTAASSAGEDVAGK